MGEPPFCDWFAGDCPDCDETDMRGLNAAIDWETPSAKINCSRNSIFVRPLAIHCFWCTQIPNYVLDLFCTVVSDFIESFFYVGSFSTKRNSTQGSKWESLIRLVVIKTIFTVKRIIERDFFRWSNVFFDEKCIVGFYHMREGWCGVFVFFLCGI